MKKIQTNYMDYVKYIAIVFVAPFVLMFLYFFSMGGDLPLFERIKKGFRVTHFAFRFFFSDTGEGIAHGLMTERLPIEYNNNNNNSIQDVD